MQSRRWFKQASGEGQAGGWQLARMLLAGISLALDFASLPVASLPAADYLLLQLRSGPRHQRRGRDFQRGCNPEQAFERGLALAALQHSDEGPIQIGGVRKILLRERSAFAVFAQHFAEGDG